MSGITGRLNINLAAGNDNLTVHQGTIARELNILMGDGADATVLANLTIGRYLHYEGNSGNDVLSAANILVTDPPDNFFSSIETHDGNDTVVLTNFVDQDLLVALGAGNDSFSMSNSDFTAGPFQRLVIQGGDGTDAIALANVSLTTGEINIDVGTGIGDVVTLVQVKGPRATFVSAGTSSQIFGFLNSLDSQTIDSDFTIRGGDLQLDKP